PCAGGQACVGGPTSGGFGTCRAMCKVDTDCGGAGSAKLCSNGVCQPDCRMAPVCAAGQTCDASWHCAAGQTTTCPAPLALCRTPDGASTFCADATSDPNNCGGCGRVCAAGTICQGGICSGTQMC